MTGWAGITVAAAMARPHNNFTLVRLCLALLVVVSHAVGINTGAPEPLKAATGFTLGEHAVNGFFAVSGFLVTMSYDRRHPRDYAIARLLRIAPGFIAAVLLAAVMGAALSRLPWRDYVADAQLWRFIATTLTSFKSANTLPGVFETNPQTYVMAPVWTLRYELYCYAGVLALGLLGRARTPFVVPALCLGLAMGVAALDRLHPEGMLLRTFLRLFFLFSTGATLYLLRDRLRLSGLAVAAAFLAAWALHGTALYAAILFAAEGYGALWLALGFARTIEPRADLSYGIYLYGWPIQQALRQVLPSWSLSSLLALALLLTVAAAACSWFLVEKPALALKLGRSRRSAAEPLPAGPA